MADIKLPGLRSGHPITVIYHGNCTDGMGAAWVVREYLKQQLFDLDEVIWVPAKYGEDHSEIKGQYIIMVDFSFKRPEMLELARNNHHILVIDHHVTAEAELVNLPDNVTCLFDMDRSGAMLAWDHFRGNEVTGATPLISRIQDRDLWRFDFPDTKDVMAAVFTYDMTFEVWDELMRKPLAELKAEGEAFTRKQKKDVAAVIESNMLLVDFAGFRVPAVNCPYWLASDVGHALLERYSPVSAPFAVTFSLNKDGRRVNLSLRSTDERVRVDELAVRFGGGGHRNAAGCSIYLEQWVDCINSVSQPDGYEG